MESFQLETWVWVDHRSAASVKRRAIVGGVLTQVFASDGGVILLLIGPEETGILLQSPPLGAA